MRPLVLPKMGYWLFLPPLVQPRLFTVQHSTGCAFGVQTRLACQVTLRAMTGLGALCLHC